MVALDVKPMFRYVPFEFEAAYPRRSFRATQHSLDRLTCLGKKYYLETAAVPLAIAPDASTTAGTTNPSDTLGQDSTCKVNVVLAHANGFVKELYEPFIESLLMCDSTIIAVYIHDVATQGSSGIANAERLGDEYHWSDSGLDILCMIRHLRKHDLLDHRPIVGIGHSMGACQMAYASLAHHRMFAALVLVEPIIYDSTLDDKGSLYIANLSARRRDHWLSREDARAQFEKSPFFKTWHPAVFEKWMAYALTPVAVQRGDEEKRTGGESAAVRLTTTVAQEVYSFLQHLSTKGREESDPDTARYVLHHLKYLTHPVHFLFGELSSQPNRESRAVLHAQVQHGGTRVDLEGRGHLIPMEAPSELAALCARYVSEASTRWRELERLSTATPRLLTLTDEYRSTLKTRLEGKAKL